MVYTATEIAFLLGFAASIGAVLGWLLRGKSNRERPESRSSHLVDHEGINLRDTKDSLAQAKTESDTSTNHAEASRGTRLELEPLEDRSYSPADSYLDSDKNIMQQIRISLKLFGMTLLVIWLTGGVV